MQKAIDNIADEKNIWIKADWPASARVHAGTTIRKGGRSQPPYDAFNLAQHVGDDQNHVLLNRQLLIHQLKLPAEPCWLNQVHGRRIVDINEETTTDPADGAYTNQTNSVCVVLTADCLPLLLCDRQGTQTAAIHIGWRGFTENIIAHALEKFSTAKDQLLAWLGPCISPDHYEIDTSVYKPVKTIFPGAEKCFIETRKGHWLMDLKQLVSGQLSSLGVKQIYISSHCTYSDPSRFYSHRRDGTTGRMASLIWMDSPTS